MRARLFRRLRRGTGDRQLPRLLLRRAVVLASRRHGGGSGAAGAAGRLPARDLRPDVRVLAAGRLTATVVPRDPHVPAAQEHGLLTARRPPRHLRQLHLLRLTTETYAGRASVAHKS